ncbi:hypothetical protein E2C01_098360 [Portunus trituberculatus]|uniref:Uncharacterized protein n=1 Tax=Portunus trituberculatus TaxID=210409 RepID=A0A5B7KBX0_PORTR|nr:hypothetical protein [Portunus trituberculatus]
MACAMRLTKAHIQKRFAPSPRLFLKATEMFRSVAKSASSLDNLEPLKCESIGIETEKEEEEEEEAEEKERDGSEARGDRHLTS